LDASLLTAATIRALSADVYPNLIDLPGL
jgi:hypothetical protein